ncbi:MAG: serine/threonine-protein kinase, partial [Planctomycetota bacterium]
MSNDSSRSALPSPNVPASGEDADALQQADTVIRRLADVPGRQSNGADASPGNQTPRNQAANNQAANNQVPSDYVQGEAPAGGPADTGFFTPSDSSVPEVPLDDTASPAALARGLLHKRLNHFVLEAFIGGGGMGAVFRGRDQRLDRTVAVKVIPRVGDDADLQRRFRNEAQAVARLDHPNIAKVFDVGRYRGWHYIVFEHVEGTNTRDLVARQGVLSIDDAVYHIQQVAEALQHASQRGITHRDIKPSNVLVRPDGQIKLVDMGLARSQSVEVADD